MTEIVVQKDNAVIDQLDAIAQALTSNIITRGVVNSLHPPLVSYDDELSRRELSRCLALGFHGITSKSKVILALSVLEYTSTIGSVLNPPL